MILLDYATPIQPAFLWRECSLVGWVSDSVTQQTMIKANACLLPPRRGKAGMGVVLFE